VLHPGLLLPLSVSASIPSTKQIVADLDGDVAAESLKNTNYLHQLKMLAQVAQVSKELPGRTGKVVAAWTTDVCQGFPHAFQLRILKTICCLKTTCSARSVYQGILDYNEESYVLPMSGD
jgi:hypothetical protein